MLWSSDTYLVKVDLQLSRDLYVGDLFRVLETSPMVRGE